MFESCVAAAAISDRLLYPELRFSGYRANCVFSNREFLYCGTREIGYKIGLVGKAVTGLRPNHSLLAPSDSCVLSTGVALTTTSVIIEASQKRYRSVLYLFRTVPTLVEEVQLVTKSHFFYFAFGG